MLMIPVVIAAYLVIGTAMLYVDHLLGFSATPHCSYQKCNTPGCLRDQSSAARNKRWSSFLMIWDAITFVAFILPAVAIVIAILTVEERFVRPRLA
jgi:hypothetical protein